MSANTPLVVETFAFPSPPAGLTPAMLERMYHSAPILGEPAWKRLRQEYLERGARCLGPSFMEGCVLPPGGGAFVFRPVRSRVNRSETIMLRLDWKEMFRVTADSEAPPKPALGEACSD